MIFPTKQKRKNVKAFLGIPAVSAMLFLPVLAFADTSTSNANTNAAISNVNATNTNAGVPDADTNTATAPTDNATAPAPSGTTASPDVADLQQQIRDKQAAIDQLNEQQKTYEEALGKKRQESLSLQNEIGILDTQVSQANVTITKLGLELDTLELAIDSLNLQIQEKQIEIEQQKSRLGELIRVANRNSNRSTLEITMLNSSFSDYYNQLKYLESVELEAERGLSQIQSLKTEFEAKQQQKMDKRTESEQTKSQLELQRKDLQSQQNYRTTLLAQTQNSETQYQDLLNQAKQEQLNANADIQSIEAQIRKRLAGNNELPSGPTSLIWPIISRTITSYFHDPNYIFRRYFEHPAIDVAAPQGTPIRAAATGYVGQAKNAGMGYSYIMLVHGNDLSTVYGHVSSIAVVQNDFVVQGQVIGYTGGTPGTPGAGNLTTGPHLHFEVRSGGIPVNPLNYLP